MTDAKQLWSGGWWRYTRYEIRDGAIRPANDAKLTWYDPWEVYRKSEWDTGTPRPYISLIALMQSLGGFFDEETSMWRIEKSPENPTRISYKENDLTPHEQAKLLDWCSCYGLLGILPHTALTIEMPVRSGPHARKGLYFSREHVRVNGKWLTQLRATCTPEVMKNMQLVKQDLHLLKQDNPILEPPLASDHEYYRVPKLSILSKSGITPDFNGSVPVTQILSKLFPDSKDKGDQFECPLPLEPAFWEIYSEPLRDFLENALAFVQAVEPVLAHRHSARPSWLEWFLAPVGVSLSYDSEKAVHEQWVCPSLLSSFARMALQDISGGMQILRCGSASGRAQEIARSVTVSEPPSPPCLHRSIWLARPHERGHVPHEPSVVRSCPLISTSPAFVR